MDALTKSPSALLIVNDSALTMGLEEKMQQTPQEDDPSWPFSMCILSIAFGVFGAFGNSLVILVLFSASILNTTDVLVLALAINDLVGSVVVVPMDVNMYLTNFACLQNLGVCMFYHIVFYLVFTQSNSLLMEIAIDRFLLVCFPFESYLTKTLCVKILFCGLIVSLALGTITGLASCLPDVQLAVIMFISDWLMVFVMCLTIVTITASYTAIYVAIRNHKKKMIKNCNPMAGYVGTANSKLVTSAHRNNVSVIPSTLKDKPSATVTKHSAIYSNFNVDTGYNLLRQSLLGSNLRDSLSAETQRRTVSDQAVGFDEDRTDPPGWNPNHTTKLKNV